MAEITLGGNTVSIKRSKFKGWIELEGIRENIFKAVERSDVDEIADFILLYLSTALDISVGSLITLPWKEVATAYSIAVSTNYNIRLLPFMKFSKKQLDDERDVWDYDGRMWYSYANKIADRYKWTLDYIAELEIDDAFSLIQEILVSDQMSKEWEWLLTDKSVGYDEATKKSRYIEFPRPDWMKPIPKPPKKEKIPKFMLPVGNIVRYTTRQDVAN